MCGCRETAGRKKQSLYAHHCTCSFLEPTLVPSTVTKLLTSPRLNTYHFSQSTKYSTINRKDRYWIQPCLSSSDTYGRTLTERRRQGVQQRMGAEVQPVNKHTHTHARGSPRSSSQVREKRGSHRMGTSLTRSVRCASNDRATAVNDSVVAEKSECHTMELVAKGKVTVAKQTERASPPASRHNNCVVSIFETEHSRTAGHKAPTISIMERGQQSEWL